MAVVPFVFANQTGQIPLSELDVNFANCKAFAETAGTVTANAQANITSVGTLTTLTVSGNVIAPNFLGNVVGNVTGNISGNITVGGANTQVLFNDNGTANATAGMTFNKSSNAFVVSGNVTGGNLRTAGQVSATGNVTGGNLATTGTISATGVIQSASNVEAANFSTPGTITAVGNITCSGSLIATGNSFLRSLNTLENISGNVIFGNVIRANTGQFGVPVGVTTMFIGNVNPTTIWMGGDASNVHIGNVNGTTRIAGNLTAGAGFTATGNVTGGNIITSGVISATGNVTGGNLSVVGTSTLSGVSTAPTAANGTSNTQIATTQFVQNTVTNALPTGVILMWSGSIGSIPTGWALCNGANGTPDLRDRFIVGAGSTYAVAATGGSANAIVVSHNHTATSTVTDPGHTHTYNDTVLQADFFGNGANASTQTTGTTSTGFTGISVSTAISTTGSSGTNANLPPYYALAYIIKV